jgi:nicotinamide mononucleotide adenylyltransferase
MKSFKQFNEEKKNEIVFTFGRFNPPTVGHEKLIRKVAAEAIGNSYRVYASHSNDAKRNPLEYKEKIHVMRKMFPKHGRNIIEDKNAKTVFDIATALYEQGFTKIKMVVGSDRVAEFQKLLKKYNQVKGRHGFYDFEHGIDVISAGERDPDAEGVSGMSASKMRQAAIDGDFKSFSQGLTKAYGDDMTLFNLIRKRMGLKEMLNFRKHVQLEKVSDKREQYINGELFNIGDQAITESGIMVTIKHRKPNYVIDLNDKKYFIEKLNPVPGQSDEEIEESLTSILQGIKKKASPENIRKLQTFSRILTKIRPNSKAFKSIDKILSALDPNALEKIADSGLDTISHLASLKLKNEAYESGVSKIIKPGISPSLQKVWGSTFSKGKIRIAWSQMRGGVAIWVSGRMEGELHDTEQEAIEWLEKVGVDKKRIPKIS